MRWMLWLAAGAFILLTASLIPGPYSEAVRVPSSPHELFASSHLDAATMQTIKRSCINCHSYETKWPAYSYVAPVSWLVRRDVSNGRKFFNLSLWQEYGAAGQAQLMTAARQNVLDSSMPPKRFLLLHPDAQLTDSERAQLASALEIESARLSKEVSTQP